MNSREVVHHRQARGQRQGVDAKPVGAPRKKVLTDKECVRAAFDRFQGGRDILRPPDFKRVDLEAEHAGRRLTDP